MIVTRADFLLAMQRQKPDRMDLIEPSQHDANIIYVYAKRLLPLIVQAEALFWENGGKVETPKQAALALALHQIEPEMFAFSDCRCGKELQDRACYSRPAEPCARRAWLDLCRERAAMPPNVATPTIPIPERGQR